MGAGLIVSTTFAAGSFDDALDIGSAVSSARLGKPACAAQRFEACDRGIAAQVRSVSVPLEHLPGSGPTAAEELADRCCQSREYRLAAGIPRVGE